MAPTPATGSARASAPATTIAMLIAPATPAAIAIATAPERILAIMPPPTTPPETAMATALQAEDVRPLIRAKVHKMNPRSTIAPTQRLLTQPELSGLRPSARSAGPTWPEMAQMRKSVAMGYSKARSRQRSRAGAVHKAARSRSRKKRCFVTSVSPKSASTLARKAFSRRA